ncbi:MAG: hypothetical protein QOJ58_5748 [Alphaproteobacteria bacterium]|jgi:hypothetical protein|nr:hypothetical protein [Alphaproteobacteria bacterium]
MDRNPAGDAPFVLDALVGTYVELRDAWRAALLGQDCSRDAPWQRWRDQPEDTPMTARYLFMQYAEESGMLAAQAVTQHLGLLARAYWLDPADPDGSEGRRWLHAAPFAPARAAMEGTAMSGWLLDPEPDPDERVRRGAALALWSHPTEWEGDVRAAGLVVGTDERNVRFVRTGEDSRPLSIGAMIKAVHGRRRADLYSRWSKLLHNDPRTTATRTTYRRDADGRTGSGIFREDEHLALGTEVAGLLAEAGRRQADYFGRTAAPLVETCTGIATTIDAQLRGVAAEIEARAARERGER